MNFPKVSFKKIAIAFSKFLNSYFCNAHVEVELHVHLDGGAINHHTTYELLK